MGVTTIPYSSSPSTSPHKDRGHSWGHKQERYERAFDHPGQYIRHWRQGDIAFLKPEDAFSSQDYQTLIEPSNGFKFGYLPPKATGHPVIILSSPTEKSTHVLVTPVSAYSSSEQNNFLPPWKQAPHQWKYHRCFRSFYGCERYTNEFPYLYLEDGKSMPKPKASWIYIQSLWAVPLSVIGIFTKTRELLRVREDSVKSILDHMRAECKRWKECMAEMEAYERRANGISYPSPAVITNWREPSPIENRKRRSSVSSGASSADSSCPDNRVYTITYAGYNPRPKKTPSSWASVAKGNNSSWSNNSGYGTNGINTNGSARVIFTTTGARRISANTGRDYKRDFNCYRPNNGHQQGRQRLQSSDGPWAAPNNNKKYLRFARSKAAASMDWRKAVSDAPTARAILV